MTQVSSRGLRYDFSRKTLKRCANATRDQQIGRPAVDVANQPAELHLRDDELHALVGFLGARPVVEEQQNAGGDLDAEEKQRHPAQVVPDLLRVDRDALLGDEVPHAARDRRARRASRSTRRCHASSRRLLALSVAATRRLSSSPGSPRRFTTNFSSGRGGGPDTTLPPGRRSRCGMRTRAARCRGLYCTVQSRCVQMALNARRSPFGRADDDGRAGCRT